MGEAMSAPAKPCVVGVGPARQLPLHCLSVIRFNSNVSYSTAPRAPAFRQPGTRINHILIQRPFIYPLFLSVSCPAHPQHQSPPGRLATSSCIMSLFGESPPRETQAKSSLFDDRPTNKPGAGLFADEGPNGSPWDMPTPKKNARRNLVKSLLASSDVPDKYIETFDALLEKDAGAGGGGTVSIATLRAFVGQCRIKPADANKVMEIVAGGGATSLGRSEVNVLLALIGLAQEDEELSLDAVDERKNREYISVTPRMNLADFG